MKTSSLSQQIRIHAHIIHHAGWRHWRLARRVSKREPVFLSLADSAQLFCMLERLRPRYVLEMGKGNPGLLEMWTHFLKPGGTVIGVDLKLEEDVVTRVHRQLGTSRGLRLFDMPVHQAIPAVHQIIGGGRLDVVLLPDQENSQQRIADFERFRPLVRNGGLMILPNLPSGLDSGTHAEGNPHAAFSHFWQDLRRQFFCKTLGSEDNARNTELGLVWV